MMHEFYGRDREIKRFKQILDSKKSEFAAVFGRRRVGKTHLIRYCFNNKFSFQLTGKANVNTATQLLNFYHALQEHSGKNTKEKAPKNWHLAFQQLKKYLQKKRNKVKVIFIDELPWLDTPKSNFIAALEHFWNDWASARTDIKLIVCGSAASWMVHNLINNVGGLYNRVSHQIKLEPFNLHETEQLLKGKNKAIDRYQIMQLYMVFGGVPYYLQMINPKQSAAQNINQLLFAHDAQLKSEFERLFQSLFNGYERHIKIIKAISTKNKGLTRKEIIAATGLPNSGRTTALIQELVESGFARKYFPFEKTERNSLYQLSDFYSSFYLKFLHHKNINDHNYWINTINSAKQKAWSGYAFEQVCLQHIAQIKKALGISGILTQASAFKISGTKTNKGIQIDLIIDRNDNIINVCEMKFYLSAFSITKKYANELKDKLSIFKEKIKSKKAIHLTFVSTFGVKENAYKFNLVQNEVVLDDLYLT